MPRSGRLRSVSLEIGVTRGERAVPDVWADARRAEETRGVLSEKGGFRPVSEDLGDFTTQLVPSLHCLQATRL